MISDRKSLARDMSIVINAGFSAERAEQLRQLLAARRGQEGQRLTALRDLDTSDCSTFGDPADTASQRDIEFAALLAEIAASRVADVENALQRVEQGAYGVCEDCREEIPLARLRAMPATIFCVDCQRIRENGSKQAGASIPLLWVTANEPQQPAREAVGNALDETETKSPGSKAIRRRHKRTAITSRW